MPEETTLEELVAAEEAGATASGDEEEAPGATGTQELSTQPGDADEEDTGEGPDDDQEDDDTDAAFFDALGETGATWKQKYGTKAAFLQGVAHLNSRIGQKEAVERVGEALLEKLGREKIAALLRGEEPAEPKKPDGQPDGDLPKSWEELLYAQRVLEDENAPADTRDRAKRQFTAFQQRLFTLVSNPQGVLASSDHLKKLSDEVESLKKTTTEAADQAAQDTWVASHRSELWSDQRGDWTPLGSKVNDILTTHAGVSQIGDRKLQLDTALELARASMPKAKPHRQVSKEAKHQRATGREGDDLRTDEERMKAALDGGMSEEEFLKTFVFPQG